MGTMFLSGFLLIVGMLLIFIEVMVPGFGVFGVFGLISSVASVVLGVIYVESYWIVVVASVGIVLLIAKFIKIPEGLILNDKSGVVEQDNKEYLLGKEGKVVTVLKPVGRCLFDDKQFECYAINGIIEKDRKVVVKEIKENKVFVDVV